MFATKESMIGVILTAEADAEFAERGMNRVTDVAIPEEVCHIEAITAQPLERCRSGRR